MTRQPLPAGGPDAPRALRCTGAGLRDRLRTRREERVDRGEELSGAFLVDEVTGALHRHQAGHRGAARPARRGGPCGIWLVVPPPMTRVGAVIFSNASHHTGSGALRSATTATLACQSNGCGPAGCSGTSCGGSAGSGGAPLPGPAGPPDPGAPRPPAGRPARPASARLRVTRARPSVWRKPTPSSRHRAKPYSPGQSLWPWPRWSRAKTRWVPASRPTTPRQSSPSSPRQCSSTARGRVLLSPHTRYAELDLTDLHFLDVAHALDATREPAAPRPLTCSPRADYLDQHAATE